MRPVDQFFRSLREAFAPSEHGPSAALIGLALAVIAGAVVLRLVFVRYRRYREAAGAFARFLVTRRIASADARLIERLAARAGVSPLLVATHVDLFERATAIELRARAINRQSGEQGLFAHLLRLREGLGFHNLPEHYPLLTTRELGPGVSLEVAGAHGRVGAVNEACFVVEIPQSSSFALAPEGEALTVSLVRGHEARYTATCRLLTKEEAGETVRLVLLHDEHPSRIQLRAAVRVSARGNVELRPALGRLVTNDETDVIAGSLLDISLGGIALETKSKIAVGSAVRASFDLDGSAFRDLTGWVLECEPRRRGFYRLRLKFRDLPASDETALGAVVARRSAKAL